MRNVSKIKGPTTHPGHYIGENSGSSIDTRKKRKIKQGGQGVQKTHQIDEEYESGKNIYLDNYSQRAVCQESNTLESVNGELWRLLAVGAAEFVEKNKYIDLINQNRKQYAEDHSD